MATEEFKIGSYIITEEKIHNDNTAYKLHEGGHKEKIETARGAALNYVVVF